MASLEYAFTVLGDPALMAAYANAAVERAGTIGAFQVQFKHSHTVFQISGQEIWTRLLEKQWLVATLMQNWL